MKKETVSRFNEVILTTSDLNALKGKYLTENLYRRWEEKFIDEEQNKFYQIEVEIMVNKESYPMRFLVKAPNAEEAKVLSEAFYETYMRVADEDKELPPYTMTLLSAKTLNVEAVIDHQFCKEYIDKSKETL